MLRTAVRRCSPLAELDQGTVKRVRRQTVPEMLVNLAKANVQAMLTVLGHGAHVPLTVDMCILLYESVLVCVPRYNAQVLQKDKILIR